ncbi:MAG: hypothetical protein HKO05_07460 [Erythrobacter sp.]|nr:hypothetical protein [Erythrobacter sp.]RZV33735.1 MAG: hypothetical protein EX262_06305 [Sphingomonadaceae bacterium]
MDSELVLIFGFILTIIVLVTFGVNSLVDKHLKHKRWLEERRDKQSTRVGDDKHAALEERVRVLERIATENNEPLAMQIEQLRDLQSLDTEITREQRS